jgi:iron(III) transport system permease protein
MLVLVVILVVYPIVVVTLGSFLVGRSGEIAWSLEPWRKVLSDPTLLISIWNTILVTAVRQAIAFPIAILIAWTLARTDIPGATWLEFLFWVAFFLPALPVTLGWIMLLHPNNGLLNQLVLAVLPSLEKGPFNIYSFWGIIWAHLASGTIAVKVMLLTPAFRNLDASLEEASRICGANTLMTLLRVIVPVMTPTLVVVLLLSVIYSLQAFELEWILGTPFRFQVFSTQIYLLLHQDPPQFATAMAMSTMILGLMLPLLVMQRWIITRRDYVVVGGRFRAERLRLGCWRLPVFCLVLTAALVLTIIPFAFLLMATFMKLFGFFNVPQPWTVTHWERVLNDAVFLTSVRNTLALAGGTAVSGALLYTLVAYVSIRTHFTGRAVLDVVSWLPSTLPGIILGLGLLSLFLGSPLRPMYGTIFLMTLAMMIVSMPVGVQIIKSSLVQLSSDLEEAARVSGATWLYSFRSIVLPLIAPTVLLVAAVSFITAARNVSAVALLATSATRPLSLLQLDLMFEGRYEAAAVVGVVVVALTTGVALAARLLGLRGGLENVSG